MTKPEQALLAIQGLMNGVEWNSDTTTAIAEIMIAAGYPIRDLNEPNDDPELPAPSLRAYVGTNCSVCGASQFDSPSGITCSNGHGGADSIVQDFRS